MPDQIPVTNDDASLLLRLIGGDAAAAEEILALAPAIRRIPACWSPRRCCPATPATWSGPRRRRVPRGTANSSCWRETHLHGDTELFDVLVRDHLADHPDHLMAAWIAGRHH